MEFIEIVMSGLDYVGAPDKPVASAEYNQYDDVGEPMSDVPFVHPVEIWNFWGKISIRPARMVLWDSKILCTFDLDKLTIIANK